MHELGIVQSIINITEKRCRDNGGGRIVGIRIVAGELRGIIKNQLEVCFKFAAKGTPAEDAWLEIETVPVEAYCDTCQKTFQVHQMNFYCDTCQQFCPRLLRGKELRVEEILML